LFFLCALGALCGSFSDLEKTMGVPFGIGLAAQTYGLHFAMWLLLAGPIALLIGLPRRNLQE
jgi:FSR family fosmidomycin resistance protein-like MFS transporter